MKYSVIICAVSLTLSAVNAAQQPAAATAPRATFPETTRNVGNVSQGEKMTHTFVVRNEGTGPLRIEGVELRSPGMKTRFKSVIPPGESGQITLECDTSLLDGPSEAAATVRLSDADRPKVELVLSGTVIRAVDILPMPAVYFSVYKGETATRSVTIVNRETTPLEIRSVEPAGEHFVATIAPVTEGKTYRLDVRVPEGVTPGRYMESVYLNTNHPTVKRLHVAVNVLVKNDLYVNPEAVNFGVISLSELAAVAARVQQLTQKLIVRRRTGEFSIKSVTSSVPGVEVAVSSEGRASAFQIDVTIARERLTTGRLSGTIKIETDDKEFPVLNVPVSGEVR